MLRLGHEREGTMLTAQERRKKIDDEAHKRKTEASAKMIAKVTEEIESNEKQGYVHRINCNSEVIKYLEALGYTVTHMKAAGTVDIDSHRIEW